MRATDELVYPMLVDTRSDCCLAAKSPVKIGARMDMKQATMKAAGR